MIPGQIQRQSGRTPDKLEPLCFAFLFRSKTLQCSWMWYAGQGGRSQGRDRSAGMLIGTGYSKEHHVFGTVLEIPVQHDPWKSVVSDAFPLVRCVYGIPY